MRIIPTLAALAAAAALSLGLLAPAQAAPTVSESVSSGTSATRINKPSYVSDIAGDRVKVKFVNLHYKWLVQKGSALRKSDWTTNGVGLPATINSRSEHDDRCMSFVGAGLADGKWKVEGGTWVPMHAFNSSAKWYPIQDCHGVRRWLRKN